MIFSGNIFGDLPPMQAKSETVDQLLSRPDLRIERIVSTGQASASGFWYDQPWDEWVIMLSGAAQLRFEKEREARILAPGDHLLIPAHERHRVDWTNPDHPTVWLAVHFPPVAHQP